MTNFKDRLLADKLMEVLKSLALIMRTMDGFKATFSMRLKHIAKSLAEAAQSSPAEGVSPSFAKVKKNGSLKIGGSSPNLSIPSANKINLLISIDTKFNAVNRPENHGLRVLGHPQLRRVLVI